MIKLLILDVDGILTDGKKYYDSEGNVRLKTFCDKDWTAIKRFRALGINVIFLTGDPFNVKIAENRNIDVYVNRSNGNHKDKVEFLSDICKEYEVKSNEVAYAGDDIFDVKIMRAVGYSFCPADSPDDVRSAAKNCVPGTPGNNFVMFLFDYMRRNRLLPEFNFYDNLKKVYELDEKEKF